MLIHGSSTAFYVSYGALWILLLVTALLVLLLYRHFGLMSLATSDAISRDGLPVGESAPALTGVDASGDPITWQPEAERPTLLFFAASGCKPCGEVVPHVERLVEAAEAGQISLSAVAVVAGAEEAAASFRPCIRINHPMLG
jgi:cytochrome oxidase Cu insertion factor (SCO1/SenC/PrrC family)